MANFGVDAKCMDTFAKRAVKNPSLDHGSLESLGTFGIGDTVFEPALSVFVAIGDGFALTLARAGKSAAIPTDAFDRFIIATKTIDAIFCGSTQLVVADHLRSTDLKDRARGKLILAVFDFVRTIVTYKGGIRGFFVETRFLRKLDSLAFLVRQTSANTCLGRVSLNTGRASIISAFFTGHTAPIKHHKV